MKRLVFDLDRTLTHGSDGDYIKDELDLNMIEKLREYKVQ